LITFLRESEVMAKPNGSKKSVIDNFMVAMIPAFKNNRRR